MLYHKKVIMVKLGIALDIAAPVLLLVCIIVGAWKAWPYRKTDRERFTAIYKPYKWWGLGGFIVLNTIGLILIACAQ